MRRRSARLATFFRSRTRQLVWAGSLAALGAALLEGAYETADFTRDLLVNLGVGVVMVGLTFVVFDPIVEDMRRNAVQEHRDLNHDQLVADIAAARGEVDVLETWTGLLEDRHRDRFLAGTVAALGRGVHFRLLLLDPESQAAEQRADELHLPVPQLIMDNLQHLSALRARLEPRLTAAGPAAGRCPVTWSTPLDERRASAGFFDTTWRSLVDGVTPAVRAHLAAERTLIAGRLAGYRAVVEGGCAGGTLPLPVITTAGLDYLGLDRAPGAVAATRAAGGDAVCGDVRDVDRLAAQLPRPALLALPFNVFGNIPEPREVLAAAVRAGTDVLVLTYRDSPLALRVRAGYYRRCGLTGVFRTDEAGVHFDAGLVSSTAYRPGLVREWLAGAGYEIREQEYGAIGLAVSGARA